MTFITDESMIIQFRNQPKPLVIAFSSREEAESALMGMCKISAEHPGSMGYFFYREGVLAINLSEVQTVRLAKKTEQLPKGVLKP